MFIRHIVTALHCSTDEIQLPKAFIVISCSSNTIVLYEKHQIDIYVKQWEVVKR